MVQPLFVRSILQQTSFRHLPAIPRRHKSIRAAIERGVSQSHRYQPGNRDTYSRATRDDQAYTREDEVTGTHSGRPRHGARQDNGRWSGWRSGSSDSSRAEETYASATSDSRVPDTLPYTTAASEFLYGHGVVLAALTAGRRRLYNLYIHDRGMKHDGSDLLMARARAAGVKIHEVGDQWLRVLDRASSGRPHNVRTWHSQAAGLMLTF